MEQSRTSSLLTDKMHKILRRDTILAVHVAVAIVAMLDIFREPNETFPLHFKIISIGVLLVYSFVGIYRMKKKTKSDIPPIAEIIAYAAILFMVIVLLADYGSPYIYFTIQSMFLASLYYSKKLVYVIYGTFAVAILLQPIVQQLLFSDVYIDDQITFNNYALNLMAYIATIAISRLVINSTLVSQEDKLAIEQIAKQEKIERERVEKIVSVMNDAVIGLDNKRAIVFSNSIAYGFVNTHENILHKNITELLVFEDESGASVDIDFLISNALSPMTKQLVLNYGNDEKILANLIIKPIMSETNTIDGYVVILHDITEETNKNEDRRTYVSLISHELRTPLAVLEARLSSMLPGSVQKMTPEQTIESIEDAHKQTLKVTNIVNDMSLFVDIGDSEKVLQRGKVDLIKSISGIIEKLGPNGTDKGLVISSNLDKYLDKNATINSHEEYVNKILYNLIDNAIKFTDEGTVSIELLKTSNGYKISVNDTGKGISSHQLKSIFQVDHHTEKFEIRTSGGLGLSLYVANRLANVLEGTINATSELGIGSTFALEIPIDSSKKS